MTGVDLPERAIPLLTGIVGSTAYGLNRPGSDVDTAAVYAWPTRDLIALAGPGPDTVHHTATDDRPDLTAHEARKFLSLVLNGNPSVTEMLWLDDYTHTNPWGHALIDIRQHLSAGPRIRRTYLGYATQQFRKLDARGDGSFSSDTRKRTAKHARHLLRLCRQGFDFYTTGTLTVRVTDPREYLDFGDAVAAGDLDQARRMLAFYESGFDTRPCALPAEPDTDRAAAWLAALREDYW